MNATLRKAKFMYMKHQRLLSFFPILFMFYLPANAQNDLPPNAQPGKCYAQGIYPDKYSDEIKQIFEYTGTDYKAKKVKRKTFLVDTPVVKETYYIVKDTVVNKQFKITEIPVKVLEYTDGRSGWVEVLCEKDINYKKIREVQEVLKDKGYYDGAIDGIMDGGTKAAFRKFKEDNGLPIGDGLSISLLKHLGLY